MRITGSTSTALAGAPAAARRAAGSGFALTDAETTKTQNRVAALRTIGGIDALVALQGVEDATEKRKRAVRHGRSALDALDAVKVGLLSGQIEPSALHRLKAVALHLKDPTGDAGLDGVLAEIDLRLEVEIAKLSLVHAR